MTPRERVAWLRATIEQDGVRGLEWEDVPLSGERASEWAALGSVAIRLRFFLPLEDPRPVFGFLSRLQERGVWFDARTTSVRPLSVLRRFACEFELVFTDPGRVFESPQARKEIVSSNDPAAQFAAVSRSLNGEVRAHMESLPADQQSGYWGGLVDYVWQDSASADEPSSRSFEASLPKALRAVAHDLRLVGWLCRSARRQCADLEEWVEKERFSPSGELLGRAHSYSPWPFHWRSAGLHVLTDPATTPPVPTSDPEKLYRIVADGAKPERERCDAHHHLMAMDPKTARVQQIRTLAVDLVRLNALYDAARYPELSGLFAELALLKNPERVAPALDELANYGSAFVDAREALARSNSRPGEEGLGSIYRDTIVRNLSKSGDRSVVPRLIEALRANDRPPDWEEPAIQALKGFRAAEASEVVLSRMVHTQSSLRAAAMDFFEIADHPPSLSVLLQALDDPVLEVVSAAERGLCGQAADSQTQQRALLRIEARAKAADPKDLDRGSLGLHLRRRLGPEASPAILVRDRDVAGKDPTENFRKRLELWRGKGYAEARYRADGHRHSAWDAAAELAHSLFQWDRETQDAEAARAYDEAVRAGCRDGAVIYRLAVCLYAQDRARSNALLRDSIPALDQRYPGCPYALMARWNLAVVEWEAGRRDEALALARGAVTGESAEPHAAGTVPRWEEEVRCLRVRKDEVVDFDPGRRVPVGRRRHPAPVTSLRIAKSCTLLLSADKSGAVQVTRIAWDLAPEIDPDIREKLHPRGPTHAAWLMDDGRAFVTAGADGALRIVWYEMLRATAFDVHTILAHPGPIVALTVVNDRSAAFADDGGAVCVVSLATKRVRNVARTLRDKVRWLLSDGTWLVVVDEKQGVEAFRASTLRSRVTWRHPSDLAAADLNPPGCLRLTNTMVGITQIELGRGGKATDRTAARQGSPPIFGRFDPSRGLTALGYAAGPATVSSPNQGGGITIVSGPLSAMDVCFDHRLVAYATRNGWLHVSGYRG